MSRKIANGQWTDNISWEFHLSDQIPNKQECTAVYCLAVMDDEPERIVLTRNGRGWEMLGGHIEPGENLEEALVREALEEGGFFPVAYRQFGYRKIIASEPVVNDHHGGYYPLVAYIPHFVAITDRALASPTGEEILEAAVFETTSLPEVEASQKLIAMAGLADYRQRGVHFDN